MLPYVLIIELFFAIGVTAEAYERFARIYDSVDWKSKFLNRVCDGSIWPPPTILPVTKLDTSTFSGVTRADDTKGGN